MILSAGTNSLTSVGTQFDDEPEIEMSSSMSSGGELKTQILGERFTFSEQLRLTETEYRTLVNILKDPLHEKYYTPTKIPGYMTAADFPIVVTGNSKKVRHAGNGEKLHYVLCNFRSTSLVLT